MELLLRKVVIEGMAYQLPSRWQLTSHALNYNLPYFEFYLTKLKKSKRETNFFVKSIQGKIFYKTIEIFQKTEYILHTPILE